MRFSRCFPWKMLWKREIFLHKAIRLFQKSLKPRHLFFVCSFFSLLENNYHLCKSLLKYISTFVEILYFQYYHTKNISAIPFFVYDSVNCSSEKYEQTSSGIVLRTSTSCIIPYFRFCFHHFLPTGRLWLSPLICLLGC